MVKIWLDDERPAPDSSYITCTSWHEFCKQLEQIEESDSYLSHVDFDFYLTKHHGPTGMDAVLELICMDKFGWDKPRLAPDFTYNCHSSDDTCNIRMTKAMNEYLESKKNATK